MTLKLAYSLYITRSARVQGRIAYSFVYKGDLEDAVRFVSNVMAPRAHCYILCFDLVVLHQSRGLRWKSEMAEDVEADLESSRKGFVMSLK